MSWKGIAFGAFVGHLFGGSLGAVFGAALGNKIEKTYFNKSSKRPSASVSGNRRIAFCASAAAMLAKLAKADGVVTKSEINSVERAFARLGFSGAVREYCVNVFRKAKDDTHTIYEYADEFAAAVESVEVREIFYELLWDLAAADGVIDSGEMAILERITSHLGINPYWYAFYARAKMRGNGGGSGKGMQKADPYAELGVSSSASDAEVKKAYREKAKKYHPDTLRAQGLPESMIGKATEKMARINAAFTEIKSMRGM